MFDRFAYVVDTIDTARTVIILLGLGIVSTFTIWLAPDSDEEMQQARSADAEGFAEADAQKAMARDTYDRSMAEDGWGYSEEGFSETPGAFGQSNRQ